MKIGVSGRKLKVKTCCCKFCSRIGYGVNSCYRKFPELGQAKSHKPRNVKKQPQPIYVPKVERATNSQGDNTSDKLIDDSINLVPMQAVNLEGEPSIELNDPMTQSPNRYIVPHSEMAEPSLIGDEIIRDKEEGNPFATESTQIDRGVNESCRVKRIM